MVVLVTSILQKRISRRKLGRVADFCPICRRFEGAELFDVRCGISLEHALDAAKSIELLRRCECCEIELPAHADEYKDFSTDPTQHVDSLLAQTNPLAKSRWAERLRLEARNTAGNLNAGERRTLIAEPIFALERRYQMSDCAGDIGVASRAFYLLSVICLLLGGGIWLNSGSPWLMGVFGVGVLACPAVGFRLSRGDRGRFVRQELQPILARCLRPVRPTAAELESIINELKLDGVQLATLIEPDSLAADIATYRADSASLAQAA
jgi:hypothetical protein